MKAAYLIGKMQFEIREVADPATPDDGLVLKVDSCGVCGSDLRRWKEGPINNEPTIPGHEIGGVVERVGPNCKGYAIGDRLAIAPDVHCGRCYYCRRGWVNLCVNHRMVGTQWPGGFAEYVHLPGEVLYHGMVHHMPEGLSLDDGALSEPASSVIASQERANVGIGDTVVIFGDGPIGMIHTEVARARGAARVIVVGLMRLKETERFNPDAVIDAGSEDPVKRIRELTGGFGADVAITANPVAATQGQAVLSVRKRGRVILFGGLPKDNPISAMDGKVIHYDEIEVVGAFSYQAVSHHKAMLAIRDGQIDASKYFNLTVGLDDITRGFEAAMKGEALKVLVNP